jgi:hypothetical protein
MSRKSPNNQIDSVEQGIHNPLSKRLYTLKEAAAYLGRSEWGMRELVWKQALPVVKEEMGRKIFIDILDLENYVNRNKSTYH